MQVPPLYPVPRGSFLGLQWGPPSRLPPWKPISGGRGSYKRVVISGEGERLVIPGNGARKYVHSMMRDNTAPSRRLSVNLANTPLQVLRLATCSLPALQPARFRLRKLCSRYIAKYYSKHGSVLTAFGVLLAPCHGRYTYMYGVPNDISSERGP